MSLVPQNSWGPSWGTAWLNAWGGLVEERRGNDGALYVIHVSARHYKPIRLAAQVTASVKLTLSVVPLTRTISKIAGASAVSGVCCSSLQVAPFTKTLSVAKCESRLVSKAHGELKEYDRDLDYFVILLEAA